MFKTELQYVVIRYMLNELADEAANVGIVAVGDDPPRMIHRFLDNPAIKSRKDARVQRGVVERFVAHIISIEQTFDKRSSSNLEPAIIFEQMREYNSGILRTTAPRSVLTNDVDQEVDLLFKQWVAPGPIIRQIAVPRDPLGGLRREASATLIKFFRRGYGAPLSGRVFHRNYEVKGLTHKNVIDLAMIDRNGRGLREHLFHHVLLLPNAEESFNQAAGLCCRWVDITARNNMDRDLTAVLYKRSGQHVKGVEDAAHLLDESNIVVARLEELPTLAAKLRSQPELVL